MRGSHQFGIGLANTLSSEKVVKYSRIAENAGVGTVWIAEIPYGRSCIALAAAVGVNTKKIDIGLGVMSPFTEHPAFIAMEAATLYEITNGRMIVGLGPRDLEKGDRSNLLPTMKESVEILRGLLSGNPINYDGRIFRFANRGEVFRSPGGIGLSFKPVGRKLPIYLGVVGPRMLNLAGRVADGLLFGAFTSPGYVEYAVKKVQEGIRKAGRKNSDVRIAGYVFSSIGEDSEKARAVAKETIAGYSYFVEPVMMQTAKVKMSEFKTVKEAVIKGGVKKGVEYVSEDMVDKLMLAGTVEDSLKRLKKYYDSGLEQPVLFFNSELHLGSNPEKTIQLIGQGLRGSPNK